METFSGEKWIDTTGEIQILYIILKWFMVVCFHLVWAGFFCKISDDGNDRQYHIPGFVLFLPVFSEC